MTGGARATLREGTADLHAVLDAAVPLGHPGLDRAAYAAHLARMWGYLAPLEARMAAVPGLAEALPDLDARWRAPWLAADLTALGLDPAALPRCPTLPALPDLPAALGCAYVLEGSTLGGRVLVDRIQRGLPEVHPHATRWLRGHGPRTGARWGAFLRALEGFEGAAMLPTARATFRGLTAWLLPDRGGATLPGEVPR